MIYTESIFVCLAAPLLIAAYLLKGETRRFIGFFLLGLLACLLAGYINSYFVAVVAENEQLPMTTAQAIVRITPICEEVMKALPVFLFVALTVPKREDIVAVAIAVGLGFVTFENCCLLVQHDSPGLLFALVRGFAAGVTHTICAAILGYGLSAVHGHRRLVMPIAFALLCASSTFHAIYNFLTASQGGIRVVGYVLPVIAAVGIIIWRGRPRSA